MFWRMLLLGIVVYGWLGEARAQHSVARQWNEVLLQAIREDYAKPTVHARNLWHCSIAMYDSWAVYDRAETYLLGKEVGGLEVPFDGIPDPADLKAAREETLSYAVYRLLTHRFKKSPGASNTLVRFDSLFARLGYKTGFKSVNYSTGSPAALGNYIGKSLIKFGLQDHSNEKKRYRNRHYRTVNPALVLDAPNTGIVAPNRWQSLSLEVFIDQSGHLLPGKGIEFLSPEWGKVTPFALTEEELTIHERKGDTYWVYHDPGHPPYIDPSEGKLADEYRWGFALVAIWSSHLDPSDGVVLDISPASIGNIIAFPQKYEDFRDFYRLIEGGDIGHGRNINPHSGQSYQPQIVPRGDYTRVLAEYWADGPDSETPPGHWFTILNYVNDHLEFEKRFKGEGEILNNLEWDVKAYFTLAGAMHDAAVAAWGIKGWYDYIRPVSAIRFMAEVGQSNDLALPFYSEYGIPLIQDFIEIIEEGDPLAGPFNQNVGDIKLFSWKGHDFIQDLETDAAGVGWIRASDWWPYQKNTFVTPPFAGFVSGHSTFSRAAAEVLTRLTGDEFFPGGMGEFLAKKDEFLRFENGPSVDIKLQWATYRDAADQTSLSRIWGGIHPPADDIPGRLIGEKVGIAAFELAEAYFLSKGAEVSGSSGNAPKR